MRRTSSLVPGHPVICPFSRSCDTARCPRHHFCGPRTRAIERGRIFWEPRTRNPTATSAAKHGTPDFLPRGDVLILRRRYLGGSESAPSGSWCGSLRRPMRNIFATGYCVTPRPPPGCPEAAICAYTRPPWRSAILPQTAQCRANHIIRPRFGCFLPLFPRGRHA